MATYTTVPSYPPQMDNFRSSGQSTKCQTKTQSSTGSNSPRGHVGFINNRDEEKEKRQKYLTARYGQHQMTLIRKRLAVEDWLFEQLRKLHDCKDIQSGEPRSFTRPNQLLPDGKKIVDTDDHDCDLDLEEVLNLDSDQERRSYIQDEIKSAKVSQEDINKFIEELLLKASTL